MPSSFIPWVRRRTDASSRCPRARGCGSATRTDPARSKLAMMRVMWSGLAITVSFQPISQAFGGSAVAGGEIHRIGRVAVLTFLQVLVLGLVVGFHVEGMRSRTWNMTRCRWMGCASAVRLMMRQISVSPSMGFSVIGSAKLSGPCGGAQHRLDRDVIRHRTSSRSGSASRAGSVVVSRSMAGRVVGNAAGIALIGERHDAELHHLAGRLRVGQVFRRRSAGSPKGASGPGSAA